jgi:hypothetical protein
MEPRSKYLIINSLTRMRCVARVPKDYHLLSSALIFRKHSHDRPFPPSQPRMKTVAVVRDAVPPLSQWA